MKICVMLTCFNRKDKTINCIKSLISGNKSRIDFIVVDDGSSDGTGDALETMAKELYEKDSEHASIEVIRAGGGLYYSGGMRKAMEAAKEKYGKANADTEPDFYVLANDDVEFDAGVLDAISSDTATVLVGAMRDNTGKCSYGGIRYYSGIHYNQIGPDAADRSCDTFNANFVVIPKEIFKAVPVIDPVYVHSLGDFDYGLQIKKAGYRIEVTDHFVGTCNNNPSTGTWNDKSLGRIERIKRKESIKGAPAKQWFHFVNKNFGFGRALFCSVTPYIRILLGK
ncbi:MAG: glycosyltransferase family 2 protein [Butyrivibrio sp.]|nr:glycosyltransferase family 2 protein [Butyrivibrio sp.]